MTSLCLHEFRADPWTLFRANRTQEDLVVDIGLTRQAATPCNSVIQQFTILVCVTSQAALELRIHTDELGASCVVIFSCHEEAAVLQVPDRCADVGAGDHHCREERGPTHGARGVLVHVRVISLILTAIQIGYVTWKLLVAKHRR